MPAPLANSGRIDKQISFPIAFVLDIDCIACRPWNFTYNCPPILKQCVTQRRLARVRSPDDRDGDRMLDAFPAEFFAVGRWTLDVERWALSFSRRKERPNLLQ